MPVRSLSSSLLVWPKRGDVLRRLTAWAGEEGERHPELEAVGLFGSYARGEGGVGSDLDVVLLVRESPEPFWRRATRFAWERLPLPADVLVYTVREFERLLATPSRFARTLTQELKLWGRRSAAACPARRFARTLTQELKWVWLRSGAPVFGLEKLEEP